MDTPSLPFLSPPAASAVVACPMSDYELLRLENIKRNAEYLKSLGLGESTITASENDVIERSTSTKKRRKRTDVNINGDIGVLERRKSKRIISAESDSMDYFS